jgi:hypothetical protein
VHQSKQALAVILLNDRWRGQSALSFSSSARTPLEYIVAQMGILIASTSAH